MTAKRMVEYWTRSAEEDVKTAESLLSAKRYLPCLFYCHLFVEKAVKAIIVEKTDKPAPFGHKLSYLAKLAGLDFTKEQVRLLDDLTSFNIRARYEDYKFAIYKKAKKEYTEKYLHRAKALYVWLKEKK